jgi:hypothetical protein
MGRPQGAMGVPEGGWIPRGNDFDVPKKYSHLPASEARELVRKEQEEALEKAMEAEIQKRVQAELAKLPQGEVPVAEATKPMDPSDLVKLGDKGVLKGVNVVKFEPNNVEFSIDGVSFRIVKA